MPNQAFIIPTKFENIRNGKVNYGFRVFDDYAEGIVWLPYDMEKIPEDDLECLQLVMNSEDEIPISILDHVLEYETPAIIGDVTYSWDQIKHLFED
ncbi:MAG: hypothetical protein GF334_10290 [Candidatus Altiarchaeales archaeon]|nr:hypothetical protein [Candidatus Altiarchaeales archaeon]